MADSGKISSKQDWERFWDKKKNVHDVYSNVDRIIRNLKCVTNLNNKRILEVGAGTGRDSFQLVDEGAQVFLLDYARNSLSIIQKLAQEENKRIHLIMADAHYLPIADEHFDIVFHQGLLEHFKNPAPILKENYRVLKKQGLILADVPQKYHIYTVIKHILIFFNHWFAGRETEFTIDELRQLLENTGFKVTRCYGEWMRPSLFYRILREILLKFNWKLPLYPPGFIFFRSLRERLRKRLMKTRWSFYTFLDIGAIGTKPSQEVA